MADISKLNFYTQHSIDKIVQEGEITIVNNGDTGIAYQTAKIVEDTVTNDYGRACLMRARWSIDGGSSWQGLESRLIYFFTVSTISGEPGHPQTIQLSGLDSAISVGCDDDTIYFRTANGRHGNVTGTQPANITYTPTSRTFLIQYVLYERE